MKPGFSFLYHLRAASASGRKPCILLSGANPAWLLAHVGGLLVISITCTSLYSSGDLADLLFWRPFVDRHYHLVDHLVNHFAALIFLVGVDLALLYVIVLENLGHVLSKLATCCSSSRRGLILLHCLLGGLRIGGNLLLQVQWLYWLIGMESLMRS